MDSPKVAIITLNYNNKDDTLKCLESVKESYYPNYFVLVVDNASTDKSVEAIKETFPDVKLIVNEKNLGFSKGINRGIRVAMKDPEVRYFFIINNDVVIDKNCISELVKVGEKYENVGMLQPKMLNMYNPKIIDSTGHVFKRCYLLVDRGHGEFDSGQYDNETDIIGCCAGAGMYKRELFEDIGLFDESFWMYYEDVELSWRAYKKGWRAKYVPTAVVYHKRSVTAKKFINNYYKIELSLENIAKVVKKHGGFKEKTIFFVNMLYTGTKSGIGKILGKNKIGYRPYFKALKVLLSYKANLNF